MLHLHEPEKISHRYKNIRRSLKNLRELVYKLRRDVAWEVGSVRGAQNKCFRNRRDASPLNSTGICNKPSAKHEEDEFITRNTNCTLKKGVAFPNMQYWDFTSGERRDGVRFSWHLWPSSQAECVKNVVPLACLYTPLKVVENKAPPIEANPVRCSNCAGVLNPYVNVDFQNKVWCCPFCQTRNNFPPHYAAHLSEQSIPMEMAPQFSTVDYRLEGLRVPLPAFVFVVDTVMDSDSFAALRDSIQQAVNLLPSDARICFITFGRHVYVHQLAETEIPRATMLHGTREYTSQQVHALCGLTAAPFGISGTGAPPPLNIPMNDSYTGVPFKRYDGTPTPGGGGYPTTPSPLPPSTLYTPPPPHLRTKPIQRIFVSVQDALPVLEQILEESHQDPWITPTEDRPHRCTGQALHVALSLTELGAYREGSRILLFVHGPCSIGPGLVVSRSRGETLRSHLEIERQTAVWFDEAKRYYDGLASRAKENYTAVDFLGCSLDQVGAVEMRSVIQETGGLLLLADKFDQSFFRETVLRMMERVRSSNSFSEAFVGGSAETTIPSTGTPAPGGNVAYGATNRPTTNTVMGLGAHLEVLHSKEFTVAGAIGCLSSTNKLPSNRKIGTVAENPIGEPGSSWFLGAVDGTSTVAVFFELNSSMATAATDGKRRYIQFLTTYLTPSGNVHLRVTTTCGQWFHNDHSGSGGGQEDTAAMIASFDQEAGVVLMARYAMWKRQTGSTHGEVMRQLDRSLIRLCGRFANFTKGSRSSSEFPQKNSSMNIRLPATLQWLPQYLFHLRRSKFLQPFNSSPDEQLFYHLTLLRENLANSLVMIQPTLLSYSLQTGPTNGVSVTLDPVAIKKDGILLLDTYFQVVIFHGETIAAWRLAGYHLQPQYEDFSRLLTSPQRDAKLLMSDRWPVARYILCDQHKSEARFVLATLNPSFGKSSGDSEGDVVFTEDVCLRVFMEHLMRIVAEE